MNEPRLADVIPARWRAWVYAVLTALNAGVLVVEAADELPTWALVVLAVIDGAGFQLARSNTPAPEPPPAI